MKRLGAIVLALAGLAIIPAAFLPYATARFAGIAESSTVRGFETLPGIIAVVVGLGLFVVALFGSRSESLRRTLAAIALIMAAYLTFNGLTLVYNFEEDELEVAAQEQAAAEGVPVAQARQDLADAGATVELGTGVLVSLGGGIVGLLGSLIWLAAPTAKEPEKDEPPAPPSEEETSAEPPPDETDPVST